MLKEVLEMKLRSVRHAKVKVKAKAELGDCEFVDVIILLSIIIVIINIINWCSLADTAHRFSHERVSARRTTYPPSPTPTPAIDHVSTCHEARRMKRAMKRVACAFTRRIRPEVFHPTRNPSIGWFSFRRR